VRKYWDIF